MGLSHLFSSLLVGRRFPGSWKQNGPCQQSSAASSALESGAGEGKWGAALGEEGAGRWESTLSRNTELSDGSRGPGDSRPPVPAHTHEPRVPLPPRDKGRAWRYLTAEPQGGESGAGRSAGAVASPAYLEVAGQLGSWPPAPAGEQRALPASPHGEVKCPLETRPVTPGPEQTASRGFQRQGSLGFSSPAPCSSSFGGCS